jgi:hypothetical protein
MVDCVAGRLTTPDVAELGFERYASRVDQLRRRLGPRQVLLEWLARDIEHNRGEAEIDCFLHPFKVRCMAVVQDDRDVIVRREFVNEGCHPLGRREPNEHLCIVEDDRRALLL